MKHDCALLTWENVSIDLAAGDRPIRLVNQASLSVQRGQILGIIGESGSGKTMTCLAALGLLPAGARISEGRILLNGEAITAYSPEQRRRLRGRRISMIMQNPMTCFNPVRTVGAHILETLAVHGSCSAQEAEEIAIRSLEQVNLPRPAAWMSKYPFELSGGMLQRVMIAIALAAKAEVLIADEPTTALDAGNQRHILRELHRVREETCAGIIVITHDLGVIAELADQVAVMFRGEVVETAGVERIFDEPAHEYTRLLLKSRLPKVPNRSDRTYGPFHGSGGRLTV